MNKTIVIKLFARSYIVSQKEDQTYHNFIIKEIPKSIKENEVIYIAKENVICIENNKITNIDVNVTLLKILSTKIRTFKKSRRKRYVRHVGYRQHYGYFKINEIK